MSKGDSIAIALRQPAGAEFRKCALQVNPRHYSGTYRGQPSVANEAEYAQKMIDKAKEIGITVLAVTDHNHVGGIAAIRAAAQARAVHVFPGFELASTEGFVERDDSVSVRKQELRRQLERSRSRILAACNERVRIDERLAALPGLEETLKRYQDAGLEEDLKEQSLLVREEQVLDTIPERLRPFRSCLEELRQALPIDRVFLSPRALENLPGKEILADADRVLEQLSGDLEGVREALVAALDRADEGIAGVRERFEARQAAVRTAYETKLRELILGLSASGEAESGSARAVPEHMGSIDARPVRELIQELLEGGEDAFERRRRKYGF